MLRKFIEKLQKPKSGQPNPPPVEKTGFLCYVCGQTDNRGLQPLLSHSIQSGHWVVEPGYPDGDRQSILVPFYGENEGVSQAPGSLGLPSMVVMHGSLTDKMLRAALKSSLFTPDGSPLPELYIPILISEFPPRRFMFVPVMKYEDVVKKLPSDFTLKYHQFTWVDGQATMGKIFPNTPKHANPPRENVRFSLN